MNIFHSSRTVVRTVCGHSHVLFKRFKFDHTARTSELLDIVHNLQTRSYRLSNLLKNKRVTFSMEDLDTQPKKKKNKSKNKNKHDNSLRIVRTRERYTSASQLVDVHIVGNGGKGFSKAVVINTSHTRYLFNCGEGLQRYLSVNKLKLTKIEHLFVTTKEWCNIGGVVGLLLSSEALGLPKITFHGPPNVEGISSMCQHLGQSNGTRLEKKLLTEGGYEDTNFKFQYVPFYSQQIKTDETESASKRPRLEPGDVSVAYICTPKPSERQIDVLKCVDLGISAGPSYQLYKAGKSVTLEDGRVITPDDVLKPLCLLPSFIIVECPNSDYLKSLIECEEFKPYQNPEENVSKDMKVDLIIHFTPDHVVKLPEYQQWMNSFGADVHHVVFEDCIDKVMHTDSAAVQSNLNLLHTELFPLFPALTMPTSTPASTDKPSNIIIGENNLKYFYKPYNQLSREFITHPSLEKFQSEALEDEVINKAIKLFKENVAKLESEIPKDDRVFPEIVFLGTGSSISSKYRNYTGILLRLDNDKSIVLDCGEATIYQLYDHYGDKTHSILRTINGVYISHMHADHHVGLCGIMKARIKAFEDEQKEAPKLIVVAPYSMKKWLDYIHQRISPVHSLIKLFAIQKLTTFEKKFIERVLKVEDFSPVQVKHCTGATGLCLQYNGFKLVYSGDTMPCDNLVQQGKDCDVLIHEGTFDEGCEKEARLKTHSTTTQAIEIGQKMNAKQIILTHFSQRYSKIPVLNDKFTANVGIAFDHMTIRPCDYPFLSLLFQPLSVIFEDEIQRQALIKEKKEMKGC